MENSIQAQSSATGTAQPAKTVDSQSLQQPVNRSAFKVRNAVTDTKQTDGLCWNWKIFDGCLGYQSARFETLPATVENNGYFLLIDIKQAGSEISADQTKTFKSLLETGKFTIIVVWQLEGNPIRHTIFRPNRIVHRSDSSVMLLRRDVSVWFNHMFTRSRMPAVEVSCM